MAFLCVEADFATLRLYAEAYSEIARMQLTVCFKRHVERKDFRQAFAVEHCKATHNTQCSTLEKQCAAYEGEDMTSVKMFAETTAMPSGGARQRPSLKN